ARHQIKNPSAPLRGFCFMKWIQNRRVSGITVSGFLRATALNATIWLSSAFLSLNPAPLRLSPE
ncbi:hypothetical protein, partial [Cronobacter sakazakii]|uniref:hypothetical protein n=1 Tax=Cronobacter sakazakii TaxID=28141 RepID=UPI001AEA8652